jgi:hypothetical protein
VAIPVRVVAVGEGVGDGREDEELEWHDNEPEQMGGQTETTHEPRTQVERPRTFHAGRILL